MEETKYIVSARKYRPSTFESVVGQKALTETLRNAIRSNHLAHAYLFCGPRGVGKTTCARIFAKTINCLSPTVDHDACNQCESCTAFNEQRSFNIHELDAASNNSVEDIRNLIAEVRIPPQIGKYSVYIIDEVHMLSTGAFNALLKTLEEPPSYAIFILATTEKHKVLPTILSRCQVFDFSRITISDTVTHLQYVASQEGLTVSEEALNVVAQKADGGMRDALSIFDQLVTFCGDNITYEQAINVLNVLDTEYYFRLVDAALAGKVSEALLLFDEVLSKGFDAGHFVTGFASHLRNVLVSKDAATVQLLEVSDSVRKHFAEQGARCAAPWLLRVLELIGQCDINYRTARNKRLTVELALIKMCSLMMPEMQATQPVPQSTASPASQAVKTATMAAPQSAAPVAKPSVPHSAAPAAKMATPVAPAPQIATPAAPKPGAPVAQPAAPMGRPGVPTAPSMGLPKAPGTPVSQPSNASTEAGQGGALLERPFTQEQLANAWLMDLPSIFRGNERILAMLSNTAPQITKMPEFEIVLLNDLQVEEIKQYKDSILRLLRQKLQNYKINFTTKVDETKISRLIYTPLDKFKFLAEQNPNLNTFAGMFDMQLI